MKIIVDWKCEIIVILRYKSRHYYKCMFTLDRSQCYRV